MKPLISIIVPIYNTESYLEKCLDSLVNQTLKNIEIILINDGSPDNSEKIIKKSGKLGVSGVSFDDRDIEKAMAEGNERAKLAIDTFVYAPNIFL